MVRRNSILALLLVAVVLFGNSCKKRDKATLIYDKSYIDPIKLSRHEIIANMHNSEIPASSIAVSVEGKTVWSEALGYANLELQVRSMRTTKYRIGKTSKVITSVVYNLLDERKMFGTDTLVGDYYEEFKNKKYPLPLQHLLSETSGLRAPSNEESDYKKPGIILQKDIRKFLNDSLLFEPGQYESPSNFNYNLLGAIMEKKTKKRFGTILKDVLLDTLHMDDTRIDSPQALIENRATPYARGVVAQLSNSLFYDHSPSAPSIGMLSTADDLVKLGNALLYSEIFSDSFKKSYFKPFAFEVDTSNVANGWDLFSDLEGGIIYRSYGSISGGSANLIIYPKEKIVIAYLTNISTEFSYPPVFNVLEYFIKFQRGESLEPEE